MGDHVRVDLTLLQDTTQALKLIYSEFDNAGKVVDDNHSAVGAGELTDALGDFASNWSHHKKSLMESIDAVEKMAEKGHDTYVKVDGQLTDDLRKAQDNSRGNP